MARSSRNRTRRRGRGRFGLLFKVLCLLALVVALTAGATVFFRVEVVSVEGNHRYSREEIVEVAGIQQGDNLYAWNNVPGGRPAAPVPALHRGGIHPPGAAQHSGHHRVRVGRSGPDPAL